MGRDDYGPEQISIVKTENVTKNEIVLPYLREPAIKDYLNRNQKGMDEQFFKASQYVFGPKLNSIEYELKGKSEIKKIAHLDYLDRNPNISMVPSRIYLEYLKKYSPEVLSFDLFGKLEDHVKHPGNSDCCIYNMYSQTPLFETIQEEYRYKPLP